MYKLDWNWITSFSHFHKFILTVRAFEISLDSHMGCANTAYSCPDTLDHMAEPTVNNMIESSSESFTALWAGYIKNLLSLILLSIPVIIYLLEKHEKVTITRGYRMLENRPFILFSITF